MKIYSLFFLLAVFNAYAVFSFPGNGSGTENDPYQIVAADQLQWVNDDLSAHYILLADIDLSTSKLSNIGDHDANPETPDSALGWKPLGEYVFSDVSRGFTGSFDGNGYKISGLYINRPLENNLGLFGCISDGGIVQNVVIGEAKITGIENVGVLTGRTFALVEGSRVIIRNCSAAGDVYGFDYLGVMCGLNRAEKGSVIIQNSSAAGNVYGASYSGGFAGQNVSGEGSALIENCEFAGNVSSGFVSGGFCGFNFASFGPAIIRDSKFSGQLNSYGNFNGGFCGKNSADFGKALIENCTATGSINGSDLIGGFVGLNDGFQDSAIVRNSAANVEVEARNQVGGFCGNNEASEGIAYIERCAAEGDVSGEISSGGFVGEHIAIKGFAGISLSSSIANVNVTHSAAGGFCGTMTSTGGIVEIRNSYSRGNLNGNESGYYGGFCGIASAAGDDVKLFMENCYSTGIVSNFQPFGGFLGYFGNSPKDSSVISCYWDSETSGISSSAGGISLITILMKDKNSFQNWDFENIWGIDPEINDGYPFLRDEVTGIETEFIITDNNLQIYPNPASESVTVKSQEYFGLVRMTDLSGRVVLNHEIPAGIKDYLIDVNGIAPGMYFIEILSNKKTALPLIIR